MGGGQSESGGVLYEERQWSSPGIILICLGIGLGLGLVGCVLASATGTKAVWTSIFPWFVGGGIGMALFVWGLNFFRKLQVKPAVLRLGRRPIPLAVIESARYIERGEAKRFNRSVRWTPLEPATWGRRSAAFGVWWQPWMKDAIFVQLKPGSKVITDRWLIGTRNPQQLLELLLAGADPAAREPASSDAAPSLA